MENHKTITVGYHEIPPLVMEKNGKLSGFEIELWENISQEMKVGYNYVKYEFKELLEAVEGEKVDIGMAGITRSAEREKKLDFSHYTLTAGLNILIPKKSKLSIFQNIKELFLNNLKKLRMIFLVIFVFLMIFGNLIWLAERGISISEKYITGILESFWWIIVTISTVGYGDIAPESIVGRIIGVFVILFGLSLFGIYIGEISSALTIRKIKMRIESYKDLPGKRVATKKHTIAADAVVRLNAVVVETKNIKEAYEKLKNGEVDAVVFDAPANSFYAKNGGAGWAMVVGNNFELQSYGFAVPSGSNIREKINRAMLKIQEDGTYDKINKKWFGEKE